MTRTVVGSHPSSSNGLRRSAELALARSGFDLTFPPELEHRYAIDIAYERSRELRMVAIYGSLVFSSICLLLNAFVLNNPPWPWVITQATITPLIALLLARCCARAEVSDHVREAAAWWGALTFTLSVIIRVCIDDSQTAALDMVLVTLPVNFVLIFLRMRFPAACGFMVAALVAHVFALAVRPDVPAAARGFSVIFMACLCVPTLCAVFNLERASRRNYLHGLLQRLQIEDLAAENDALAHLSTTDPLTGAANRRRLDAELPLFCAAGRASGALLLVDIDGFKAFNDQHGHLAGDQCLRELADCLAKHLRRNDLLARYGGEEFAVLLPDIGNHEAVDAAQRMRRAVEQHRFSVGGGVRGVTVSIGVADSAEYRDPAQLVGAADAALYAAKNSGRNRVCASWLRPVTAELGIA